MWKLKRLRSGSEIGQILESGFKYNWFGSITLAKLTNRDFFPRFRRKATNSAPALCFYTKCREKNPSVAQLAYYWATRRKSVGWMLPVAWFGEIHYGWWGAGSLGPGCCLLAGGDWPRPVHTIYYQNPIRNDLCRILLRRYRVPEPDPTHVISAYLEIIQITSIKKKNPPTICHFLFQGNKIIIMFKNFCLKFFSLFSSKICAVDRLPGTGTYFTWRILLS